MSWINDCCPPTDNAGAYDLPPRFNSYEDPEAFVLRCKLWEERRVLQRLGLAWPCAWCLHHPGHRAIPNNHAEHAVPFNDHGVTYVEIPCEWCERTGLVEDETKAAHWATARIARMMSERGQRGLRRRQ